MLPKLQNGTARHPKPQPGPKAQAQPQSVETELPRLVGPFFHTSKIPKGPRPVLSKPRPITLAKAAKVDPLDSQEKQRKQETRERIPPKPAILAPVVPKRTEQHHESEHEDVLANDLDGCYELDLHNKGLVALPPTAASSHNLRSLDVSFNRLTALNPLVLRELPHLRELRAYSNELTELTLHHNTELDSLYLQNNYLAKIDGLQTLARLRLLNLEANSFRSFSDLSCNTNLTFLDLSCNGITRIHGMENLVHLEELRISRNKIGTVEGLQQLTALTELDLSHNNLHMMPVPKTSPWRALVHLQVLNLAGNQLSSLSMLSPIPTLQELYLQENCLGQGVSKSVTPPGTAGTACRPRTPGGVDRSGGGAAIFAQLAGMFPALQILNLSHNSPSLVSSYQQLSLLASCTNLVELSIIGVAPETDSQLHVRLTRRALPKLEVLDGRPLCGPNATDLRASKCGPLERRPGTPVLPRPATAAALRSSVTSLIGAADNQPRPVMRPHSARTGGFERVWTLEEAQRHHAEFVEQLNRLVFTPRGHPPAETSATMVEKETGLIPGAAESPPAPASEEMSSAPQSVPAEKEEIETEVATNNPVAPHPLVTAVPEPPVVSRVPPVIPKLGLPLRMVSSETQTGSPRDSIVGELQGPVTSFRADAETGTDILYFNQEVSFDSARLLRTAEKRGPPKKSERQGYRNFVTPRQSGFQHFVKKEFDQLNSSRPTSARPQSARSITSSGIGGSSVRSLNKRM